METEKIIFRTQPLEEDIENIREIVTSTGFFYDYEIPVAVELVEIRLSDGPECGYYFIFAEVGGRTIAYSCYGPTACTNGTYDLFWIATHHDFRGKGIGKMLLEETNNAVRELGGRMLVAETSSQPKYTPTRHFYLNNGFKLEAEIADFYEIGDGKLVYIKRL